MPVAKVFYVAGVYAADATHFPKVPQYGGNVVIRVASQRTGTQANCVARRIVQFHNLVKVRLAVGDARQSENRPRGIVRMHGHGHAHFFAYRDNSIQKVTVICPKVIRGDTFITFQRGFQLRQTRGFPARQGKPVAAAGCAAHNLQRGHSL